MGGVHPFTNSDAESSTDILVIDDSTGNDSGTASSTGKDTGTASSTDDYCFESVINRYRLRYRLRCTTVNINVVACVVTFLISTVYIVLHFGICHMVCEHVERWRLNA